MFSRVPETTLRNLAGDGTLPEELLWQAPVPMAVWDASQRLVRANAAFAHLGGCSPAGLAGCHLEEVLPQLAPRLAELSVQLLDGPGGRVQAELPGPVDAQGEPTAWEWCLFPAHAGTGGRVLVAAVAVEVTARARALEGERRLVAVLGHDLRTPLTAVIAGTFMLLRQGGLPERTVRTLERIQRSADRMKHIINDIYDFVRLRGGQPMALAREACDLKEVVVQGVEEFEATQPERRVVTELCEAAPGRFDRYRLAQVLANLLSNAAQYSPRGSAIRVSLRHADGGVALEVHNSGSHIPLAEQEAIFRAFQRGGEQLESGRNLGLGLFIVRAIARAHGGEVRLHSAPGIGTAFTVLLPAEDGEAPAQALAACASPDATKR